MRALRERLGAPLPAGSFVAFRILFGAIASLTALRFVAMGWVESLLIVPSFHFAWVPWAVEPPPAILYGLFAAQIIAGIGIAYGRRPRPWLLVWLGSFGYIELMDKALYLNHHILFILLGIILFAAPRPGHHQIPTWVVWLLRVQIGSVYVWAGLAKLNTDWLLRAEPLRTWLGAQSDLPVVGPILAQPATAYAMSWGGTAYDLGIVFLLLWPRTRRLGLTLVVVFHVVVGTLFPIGIFPVLMLACATLFLAPDWPRRTPQPDTLPNFHGRRLSALGTAAWVGAGLLICTIPGRFWILSDDVSWTEEGHRFAWRVLLNEKTGLVDYRVVEHESGNTWRVTPSRELSLVQQEQLRTQPDLIRDYALHLQAGHARAGRDVAVYADAWASLNGHPSQRLLHPDVDLTQPPSTLRRQGWILPRQ